jgi:hypothetical protein
MKTFQMLLQTLEKLLVEARQKELKEAIETTIPIVTSDTKFDVIM